jgi:protein-S-isoprenylcysteine O-methyltransferase Ste14
MKSEFILAGMWLAYGFVHTLLASNKCKNLLKGILGRFFIYNRLIYNLIATLLIVPILIWQQKITSEIILPSGTMNYILGGLMMTSGVYLVFISLKNYGFRDFFGINALQGIAEKKNFVRDELSEIIRHPLYLGILLFIWGNFGFAGTLASCITALSLSAYIRIGIYFEELKLVETFGATYQKYQKEVPMLLPKF